MLKKLPKLPFNRSFIVGLSDPTKLWLLYAVLLVLDVVFVVVKRMEIYSFLALAKRGKGNALFVFLLVKSVGQKQNVHFPLWWTCSFVFLATKQECKTTSQ